ncbi:MAG: LysR family transcriptional regulator [Pseudomonadales bacterium]|nr:LysR family transcriptional regulator [Pseudomonadales bacterium]
MAARKPPTIPPIHYLVAFEASARCVSLKAAAEELCVTPSAISQQIKSLEYLLGLTLFTRKTRGIALTAAGESFYRIASKTIKGYQEGFSQFQKQHYSPSYRISMFSFIANEVVIPKLHDFQLACPDIDLLIETSMHVEELVNSDLDCAIRFGIPPWDNCEHKLICPVSINFLASPQYLAKNAFSQMSDFSKNTLIHIRTEPNDWQSILAEHNVEPKGELFFNSYTAAIKAAEQGLGIVIGLFPLTEKIVREKKLVALNSQHLPIEAAFYFVTKANNTKRESYDVLLAWFRDLFSQL